MSAFEPIRVTGFQPRQCAMTHNRGGLLAQIEADVADHTVPLSSLLQKCILLGGEAGSEKMRDWARGELHGYTGTGTVPDYRHVTAPLMALITNMGGYNGSSHRVDPSVFAPGVRDKLRKEDVHLEDAVFAEGVGDLEALAGQGKDVHTIIPSWAAFIADVLNKSHMGPNSRVDEVYWSVPNALILGILSRIRTALADLVAELVALTPRHQEVPDKQAADQVTQFVITGDRSVINYSPQQAADGGTNITVAGGPAPRTMAVAGAHGTATGSQTATGPNASVVGSQTASEASSSLVGGQSLRADGDVVTAGQDAAIAADADHSAKEGWWTRLRKRGAIVAFSTVIGALATVAGVVVALMIAAGWKP